MPRMITALMGSGTDIEQHDATVIGSLLRCLCDNGTHGGKASSWRGLRQTSFAGARYMSGSADSAPSAPGSG